MKDDQNYELLTDKIFSGIAAIKNNYDRMCNRNNQYPNGYLVNFSNILTLLKKIKRADKMAATIGFFGGQSRGKSSLINRLAGEDILPVATKCGTTSVVIRLKHDPNVARYKLDIIGHNKENLTYLDNEFDYQDIKQQLLFYGSHSGNNNLAIETITVTHNFDKSTILKDRGGVLVDTPGAECAFDDDRILDEQNHTDVLKALAVLEDTQIVLFAERADNIGTKNSKVFFEKHLNKLRPYTVINFKDRLSKVEEDKGLDETEIEIRKQKRAIRKISEQYGVNINRAICVSCKEAIKEYEKSNIKKLEDIIGSELNNLKPENGLVVCVKELSNILSRMAEDYTQVNKEISKKNRKMPRDWVADFPNPKEVFLAGKSPFKYILDLQQYQGEEALSLLQELYDTYAEN